MSALARRWIEAELSHKVSLEEGETNKVVETLKTALAKRDVMKLAASFIERHCGGVLLGRAREDKAKGIVQIAQAAR